MSVTRKIGVQATIEIERGIGAMFRATYVRRDGLRLEVRWPSLQNPEAPQSPMYHLVCETAQKSAGAVVNKQTQVGWKRKADAEAAADEMVKVLGGAVIDPDEIEEGTKDGLNIWFTWHQLVVLRELLDHAETYTSPAGSTAAIVDTIVDRVDSAYRAMESRIKLAKAKAE